MSSDDQVWAPVPRSEWPIVYKAKLPLLKLIRTNVFKEGDDLEVILSMGSYTIQDHDRYDGLSADYATKYGTTAVVVKIDDESCHLQLYGGTHATNRSLMAGKPGSLQNDTYLTADCCLHVFGDKTSDAKERLGQLMYFCDGNGYIEIHVKMDYYQASSMDDITLYDVLGKEIDTDEMDVKPVFSFKDFPDPAIPPSFMGLFVGAPFEYDGIADYKINVGNRTFHVHRSVLKRTTDAFDAMFTHPVVENESGDYVIEDFSAEAMEAFLRVLYDPAAICDYVLGDAHVLIAIYKLADKYRAKRIRKLSAKVLSYSKIDQESICDAIIFAKDRGLEGLYKQCVVAADYIPKHFWESEIFMEFMANNIKIGCGFFKSVGFPG